MKEIFYFLFLSVFIAQSSQAQTFDWVKKIQSEGIEDIMDLEVDNAGNVVYTGNYFDTIDLNPNAGTFMVHPTSNTKGIHISKLDSNGNFLWADTFRSNNGVISVNAITVDENDNYYITGGFTGTIDFDPTAGVLNKSAGNNSSIFMVCVGPSGQLIWARVLDGSAPSVNYGYDIKFSKSFGLILSGTCGFGNVDFDPGPTVYLVNRANRDAFIAKYDFDGDLLWVKAYGGNGPEESTVITVDSAGSIYIGGQFSAQTDFDPGPAVVMPFPNMEERLYLQNSIRKEILNGCAVLLVQEAVLM